MPGLEIALLATIGIIEISVAGLDCQLAPFRPANCGFAVDWSPHFRTRFAGRPLKRLSIRFGPDTVRGEAIITETGLEGGAIYTLSGRLRDAIQVEGTATIQLDLRPDLSLRVLEDRLGGPRRSQSLANTLRKQAGLAPEAIGLVQEALHTGADANNLPALIKSLPIRLAALIRPSTTVVSSRAMRPSVRLHGYKATRAKS